MHEDRRIARIRGDVVDAGQTAPGARRARDQREDRGAAQRSAQRASASLATGGGARAPQADRAEHEREQAAEAAEQEERKPANGETTPAWIASGPSATASRPATPRCDESVATRDGISNAIPSGCDGRQHITGPARSRDKLAPARAGRWRAKRALRDGESSERRARARESSGCMSPSGWSEIAARSRRGPRARRRDRARALARPASCAACSVERPAPSPDARARAGARRSSRRPSRRERRPPRCRRCSRAFPRGRERRSARRVAAPRVRAASSRRARARASRSPATASGSPRACSR